MAKKKPAKKAKKLPEAAAPASDINAPSAKTIKRLFAVSGNRCAFRGCTTPITDSQGAVFGEICHIKGDKPGAKRHDPTQTGAERHGFDNLLTRT